MTISAKMELPDIGQQCEVDSCKQLDFLPIKCVNCGKIFCKNHSSFDGHDCKSFDITSEKLKFQDTPKTVNKPCSIRDCEKNTVTTCPICQLEFCMDHRYSLRI